MQNLQEEIHAIITKCSTGIVGIFVGVIGKISYELAARRKMRFMQWIAIVGVSVFVGYVTWVWCDKSGLKDQMGYIIPVSTLLGEKILIYVTANSNRIFQSVLAIFTKKK